MSDLIESKEDRLFLQLTVAKSHNKELLTEIGMLQSEKDELKFELQELLKEMKAKSDLITKSEKINKHDLYFKGIKEVMSQLISKVSTGNKIDLEELKTIIDKSFQKWSPLKSKNDIQQQESLLRKLNKF